MSLYHREGAGRKHYDPVSMLKAQLLKHLLRVPSDRRLSLLLKRDRKMARACGFGRKAEGLSVAGINRHMKASDGHMQSGKRL